MSISDKLILLQQDITNARTAITTKGGTVTPSGGSSQLATDIATIPSGGSARLKDISPVTNNGTYRIANDCIIVDSMTVNGGTKFETGIVLPAGTSYDWEIEFIRVSSSQPQNYVFQAVNASNANVQLRLVSDFTSVYSSTGMYQTNGVLAIEVNTDYVLKTVQGNLYSNGTFIRNAISVQAPTTYQQLILFGRADNTSYWFQGTFKYLKIKRFGTEDVLYWLVPARKADGTPMLYDKISKSTYAYIGNTPTLGNDVSDESYDGFASPLQVSVPFPTKWGATFEDFYNTSVSSTPTLHDVVIPAGEANISLQEVFRYSTIKSFTATTPFKSASYYYYYCALADNPYLESVNILLGSSWSNTSNCWTYFASNCRGLKHASVNGLVGSASNAFGYMFYQCDSLEDVIWYFNPGQPYFYYGNMFNNTFRNCNDLNKITFSGLQRSAGNATNVFNYCFRNCIASYDNDINHFRFPDLEYIGVTTGTSNYGNFKYAFAVETSYSSYYGKCSLIFPEMYAIYNRNSTATNGHFAYCDALGKIYLPKFTTDGTTGKNIFNNCAYLTEIHFGIENQATVEALAGYSSKFGATNATIYFDMPNHLTVDGVVYDREDKGKYDYDNSYYSWKNGSNIIYTTNAINPAVGDTVYTKSGTTYTASGTIGAIA